MKLAELERYFASAATSGCGPLPDLDRVFLGSERLSAQDRLAIYNRGYFYRLLEALASVFGQTKRFLGEAAFERVGLAYLSRHPSDHPAVERVGRSFSEYLRHVETPAPIADLAALEWARLCALVAPDAERLASANAVEPTQFPHARFRFVPSLHWLELDPRALSAFVGTAPDLSALDPPRPPCAVAVWRRKHLVLQQTLDPLEWRALQSAVAGATVTRVCAVFESRSEPEDAHRAFQVISSWFARKWLESVEGHGP